MSAEPSFFGGGAWNHGIPLKCFFVRPRFKQPLPLSGRDRKAPQTSAKMSEGFEDSAKKMADKLGLGADLAVAETR